MATPTLAEAITEVMADTKGQQPKTASARPSSQGDLLRAFASTVRAMGESPVTLGDFHAVKSANVQELLTKRAALVDGLDRHTNPLRQMADVVRVAGIDDIIERRQKVAQAVVAKRALTILSRGHR